MAIPNFTTAFVIGYNGSRIRKLYSLTGAQIFVPADYNTFTDERLIQLSGPLRSVQFCKGEIEKIVNQVAPLLGIDLDAFQKNKLAVRTNFRERFLS